MKIKPLAFVLLLFVSTANAFDEKEIEIEYRGGNGSYSPNFTHYVSLWDSWEYLHFSLFELTKEEQEEEQKRKKDGSPSSTFTTKDRTPITVLKIPFERVNVRSMDLSWSEDGIVFLATQKKTVGKTTFRYNIIEHELELKKTK